MLATEPGNHRALRAGPSHRLQLGELEGIDLTLRFLQDKRAEAQRLAGLGPTSLGMPAMARESG
ncbi:hypothetical protein ACX801_04275 [Arthrobacter bambusae]